MKGNLIELNRRKPYKNSDKFTQSNKSQEKYDEGKGLKFFSITDFSFFN